MEARLDRQCNAEWNDFWEKTLALIEREGLVTSYLSFAYAARSSRSGASQRRDSAKRIPVQS